MKRFFLLLLATSIFIQSKSHNPPDEGMWLPTFIEKQMFGNMEALGIKLTPQQIYDVNNASIKDAIVGLGMSQMPGGFFCTAEIVSEQGLMFTNHHCVYDLIQSHSSVENDIFTNGFWASNFEEELPNEGITASILVRMEDVTDKVLKEVEADMTEIQRLNAIRRAITFIEKEAEEDGKYTANVDAYFGGNEFYLSVYEVYKDIRLVGVPPSSIGKFGGDTDNWMWPRHTGDFGLLRIYTAPDGSPATYAKENIPLKPRHHLPVSLKGIENNDFTMIWGFPGTTDRYLTSFGVQRAIDVTNPAIVKIREEKLRIMREEMNRCPKTRINYASKYAQTANYWKYFKGQTIGLKRLNVIEEKKNTEKAFETWIGEDIKRKETYGKALTYIQEGYKELDNYLLSATFLNEAALQGPELIFFALNAMYVHSALEHSSKRTAIDAYRPLLDELNRAAQEHFSNYNKDLDEKLFASMLRMYYENTPKEQHPDIFDFIKNNRRYRGDFERFAADVYSTSILADKEKMQAFLKAPDFRTIDRDLGYKTFNSIIKTYFQTQGQVTRSMRQINRGNRLFIAGLREMNPDKAFYPDANSTLRFTYGTVGDYMAADAIHYNYVTKVKGILEKKDPENEEFFVDEKLKTLIEERNFGPYANDRGQMIVNFISNNDITGGNSGSPVLNAHGHLIGIAFDGNWEAMSGDIAFAPEIQRTISVDIRYVLFIMDKYAGAQNLLDELTLVY